MASTVEDALVVRMEASLRKFERQMERGRQSAEKAAVGSERAWKRGGDQIAANANRAATSLQRVTNISGRGRFVLQNTANQFGDMAVQIGGGTSAMKAMGQQMPQLLGGFGVLGGTLGVLAPILGTIAAIGFPIAAAMLAMGDESEKTKDKIKDFADAYEQAISSLDRASAAIKRASDVDGLRAAYGAVTEDVESLIEALARLEVSKALTEVGAALDKFKSENKQAENLFGDLEGRKEALRDMRLEVAALQDQINAGIAVTANTDMVNNLLADIQAMENFEGISDKFKVDQESISSIETAWNAVREAFATDDIQAQTDAVTTLRHALAEIPDGPLADMADELALVEDMLRRALKTSEDIGSADVSSSISEAASEAERLADWLGISLSRAMALAATTPDMADEDALMGQSVLPDAAQRERNRGAVRNFNRLTEPRARRGGGGGGGGGADPREREAARIYDQTRTAAEKYAATLENLNELREAGYLSEDTHMRAVEQLGETLNETGKMGQRMGETIADSLADMIVNFDDAKSAAASLLNTLAQMFAKSAIGSLGLDNLFGSIFPSANGNVFSGGSVVPFASGGVVSGPTLFPMRGNQTGLMGEAGPEAIMPLTRLANGKLGVQSQGGGSNITFAPQIDARGADAAAVARIEASMQRAQADFGRRVVSTVQRAQKRRVL